MVCAGISSTLVRRPLNTAVIKGSAVTLHCTSDDVDSVPYWYNSLCVTTSYSFGDCGNDLIYNGFQSGFVVTEEKNATHVTRDLNSNSVRLNHAGVYLCAERQRAATTTDTLNSRSAQLIVLGNFIDYTNSSDKLKEYVGPVPTYCATVHLEPHNPNLDF